MTKFRRMPPYRLFLIDDDELIHDVVRRVFTLPMFEVSTIEGPIGATNAARTFKPDVVLVDIHLPAISGQLIFKLVQTAVPSTTLFYAFSSDSEEDLRIVARENKLDGYFSKSTPLAQIRATIEKALSR